jgi:hypothetical protein
MKKKRQQQSPGEPTIELMRALYGAKVRKEISDDVFQAAAKKVGHKDEKRLAWAIEFAQEPTEGMTPFDWHNRQLEAGAFWWPGLPHTQKQRPSTPFVGAFFPTTEELKEIKAAFLALIKTAAKGASAEANFLFPVSHLSLQVDKDGVTYRPNLNLSDTEEHAKAKIEQFVVRLAQLVGEQWDYIGFCDRKKHGCGKYFLKSRIDREFCSKTCLNRSTTYRQRGKEPVV